MTLAIGPARVDYPGMWGYGSYRGYPVNAEITSPFGPREPILTPAGWTGGFHTGVDLMCAGGTPIIYPGGRGVVMAEGAAITGYGNAVFIQDEEGYQFLFAHLQPGAHVGLGQTISRGQVVGQVGTTGASTGDHLHFGVINDGVPTVQNVNIWIDPAVWVNPLHFVQDVYVESEAPRPKGDWDHPSIIAFVENSLMALANNPPTDMTAALTELHARIAYLRTLIQ